MWIAPGSVERVAPDWLVVGDGVREEVSLGPDEPVEEADGKLGPGGVGVGPVQPAASNTRSSTLPIRVTDVIHRSA